MSVAAQRDVVVDAVSEPPALSEIYRAHARFVWRAVRRLGADDLAAEDLVHEVFIIADRKLPHYDGRAAMTSWLYGIARGVVANHRRGRARAQRREASAQAPRGPETPEQQQRRREGARLVQDFLDGLPAEQREVFVLAEVEGLRPREVAAALELSPELVHSRLRSARDKFRATCRRHRRAEAEEAT